MLDCLHRILLEAKESVISFPQYYVSYLCELQDTNVDIECMYLKRDPRLTLRGLAIVIDRESGVIFDESTY